MNLKLRRMAEAVTLGHPDREYQTRTGHSRGRSWYVSICLKSNCTRAAYQRLKMLDRKPWLGRVAG